MNTTSPSRPRPPVDRATRLNRRPAPAPTVLPGVPAFLHPAPVALQSEFARAATAFSFPAGKQVVWSGQVCRSIGFLDTGCLRVYLAGEDGREITLYRVQPHEACLLTTACILGGTTLPASATVERACTGWSIPAEVFRTWVDRESWWREFVFKLLGSRLAAVLARFEERAFTRLDTRLAGCLLSHAGADGSVHATHQTLADELASAREVVSRVLRRWEEGGFVRLQRGQVRITDPGRIRILAGIVGT